MVKFVYSLLVFLLSTFPMLSKTVNNVEWVKTVTGLGQNSITSICNDKKGNIYVCGVTDQTTDFGNGIIENFGDTIYAGFFVAKYNSDGKCQWVKRVKTNYKFEYSPFYKLCADKDDNIIVILSTFNPKASDPWDFGDGVVLQASQLYTKIGSILVKYSLDGVCQWGNYVEDNWGWSAFADLTVDDDNNIYVTGGSDNSDQTNGTVNFGNNISYAANDLTSNFLVKYSPDGKCQWITKLSSKQVFSIYAEYLKYGFQKNIILYAIITTDTDFGDGKYFSASEYPASCLINYDLDGKVIWVKQLADHYITNFTFNVDKKSNIFMAGATSRKTEICSGFKIDSVKGFKSLWIAKMSPDRQLQWFKNFDGDSEEIPYSIVADSYENLYLSGYTKSSLLQLGNTNDIVSPIHKNFLFLAKFNNSGECQWTNYFYDFDTFDYSDTLAQHNYSYLYDFNKYLDFADGLHLNSSGSTDGFLIKFTQPDCGFTISLPDLSDPTYIALKGSAYRYPENVIRLTDNKPHQTGALWYNYPIDLTAGFETEFTFRMSQPYNDFPDGSIDGADGIAFVLQTSGINALGKEGGGLGYDGIPNSLAIEYDTYNNKDLPYNDTDGNHIGVFCNGTGINIGDHNSKGNLGATNKIMQIIPDGTIYHTRIEYNAKLSKLIIYLDTNGAFTTPVLTIDSIDLSKKLNLIDSSKAIFGFTAATGTSWENQDLLSWTLCSYPKKIKTGFKDYIQNSDNSDVYFFPNPAESEIFLHLPLEYQSSKIKIYSIEGIEVYKSSDELHSSDDYKIDVSSFAPGVYYVKVGDKVCRFVKI